MSLLTNKINLAVAVACLIGIGAIAFFSFNYSHMKGEIARLEKENKTLVESILQADETMAALREQAGGCMAELAAVRQSCDERLSLWKQAKTVAPSEVPHDLELLDPVSSDAYTRSIDSMFGRLRK